MLQEDKKVKDRIDSRNGLEGYCYNLKNMLEDDEKGLADKLSEEEKETIEKAVQETLDWVDENQEADAEDFKEKQKEIGACLVRVLLRARACALRLFALRPVSATVLPTACLRDCGWGGGGGGAPPRVLARVTSGPAC